MGEYRKCPGLQGGRGVLPYMGYIGTFDSSRHTPIWTLWEYRYSPGENDNIIMSVSLSPKADTQGPSPLSVEEYLGEQVTFLFPSQLSL